MFEKYSIEKTLATGNTSSVYLASDSSGVQFVVKKYILATFKSNFNIIQTELNILLMISSPYIVKFLYSCGDINSMSFFFEFCDFGDLDSQIELCVSENGVFQEKDVLKWLYHVLESLSYIHGLKVIHRNVKPKNILLKNENSSLVAKLNDFSHCFRFTSITDGTNTFTGSPLYLAPEIYAREYYSSNVDIWSLGCTIFELCNLKHPYNYNTIEQIEYHIFYDDVPQISTYYSNDLREIVNKMLSRNPLLRPNAKDLLKYRIFEELISRTSFSSLNIPIDPSTNTVPNEDNYNDIDILPKKSPPITNINHCVNTMNNLPNNSSNSLYNQNSDETGFIPLSCKSNSPEPDGKDIIERKMKPLSSVPENDLKNAVYSSESSDTDMINELPMIKEDMTENYNLIQNNYHDITNIPETRNTNYKSIHTTPIIVNKYISRNLKPTKVTKKKKKIVKSGPIKVKSDGHYKKLTKPNTEQIKEKNRYNKKCISSHEQLSQNENAKYELYEILKLTENSNFDNLTNKGNSLNMNELYHKDDNEIDNRKKISSYMKYPKELRSSKSPKQTKEITINQYHPTRYSSPMKKIRQKSDTKASKLKGNSSRKQSQFMSNLMILKDSLDHSKKNLYRPKLNSSTKPKRKSCQPNSIDNTINNDMEYAAENYDTFNPSTSSHLTNNPFHDNMPPNPSNVMMDLMKSKHAFLHRSNSSPKCEKK